MRHGVRFIDWEARLIAYLRSVARRPEAPGQHDCQLFIAGAIEAMTSYDYAAPYRGRYATYAEGRELLKADGYRSHVHLVQSNLKAKPIAYAQEGDVAQIGKTKAAAFGIVQGSGIYVVRPIGWGLVPLSSASRAYEV